MIDDKDDDQGDLVIEQVCFEIDKKTFSLIELINVYRLRKKLASLFKELRRKEHHHVVLLQLSNVTGDSTAVF